MNDRGSRSRFQREGRLAASINHPNSVYVYGTEEIEGRPATMGSRFLAIAIDYCVLTIAISPISYWLFADQYAVNTGDPAGFGAMIASTIGGICLQVLYFVMSEWRFGRTVGKHLLGLQVVQGDSRPSLGNCLVRSLLFIVPSALPSILLSGFVTDATARGITSFTMALTIMLIGGSRYLIFGAMLLTVRNRNGYATVYDLLSKTRVVERFALPITKPKEVAEERFDAQSGTEMVGPYHILQSLAATDQGELFLGYDAALLRRVWLHIRPAGRHFASEDANTLDWPTSKSVLTQLADELTSSEMSIREPAPEVARVSSIQPVSTGKECPFPTQN